MDRLEVITISLMDSVPLYPKQCIPIIDIRRERSGVLAIAQDVNLLITLRVRVFVDHLLGQQEEVVLLGVEIVFIPAVERDIDDFSLRAILDQLFLAVVTMPDVFEALFIGVVTLFPCE